MPTRAEAFDAFFAAVNRYIPRDFLEGRTALRSAGIAYAHAAVQEALDNRNARPAQTNRVTDPYPDHLSPDDRAQRRDDIALDTQTYGSIGDDRDLDEGSKQ